MVMGERQRRKEGSWRRFASRFANACNRSLLRHSARDVGCGLKVLSRQCFLAIPYFDHMHRFMPALVAREGYETLYEPVKDRARAQGRSKYGTLDRALAGLIDIFGVYWLVVRSKRPAVEEIDSK